MNMFLFQDIIAIIFRVILESTYQQIWLKKTKHQTSMNVVEVSRVGGGGKEVSKLHCQNYREGQLLSEEEPGGGMGAAGNGKCSKSGDGEGQWLSVPPGAGAACRRGQRGELA